MPNKAYVYLLAIFAVALVSSSCGREVPSGPTPEAATASESTQRDRVELSPEAVRLAGIETAPVTRGTLSMVLRTPGRVTVNVTCTAKVTSTFEGRIRSMQNDVGAVVRQGDVMALIDSPELLNKPLELRAPISGQVIERHGTVGEAVDTARELYTITDLDSVWVIAEIKEKDIASVRVGQPVTVRVLAYPHDTFTDEIVLVGNEVEPKTRTIEARVELKNSGGRLKPGMFADLEIITSVVGDVIVIPDEALQTMDSQQVVFVAVSDEAFTKRVVTVGHEHDSRCEITGGLTEGERIVTSGSFVLKSELLKGELGEE